MTDTSVERIAQLRKLLLVDPGSEVTPAREFDPALKTDFLYEKAGNRSARA